MKKTIFLVVPTLQRIDFLLKTRLFGILRSQTKMVIISRLPRENFLNEIEENEVFFEHLESLKFGTARKNFLRLREVVLKIDTPRLEKEIAIMKSVMAQRPTNKKTAKNIFLKLIRRCLKPIYKILQKIFDEIEEIVFFNKKYERIFKKYKPRAVIIGTLGAEQYDIPVMACARKFKCQIFVADLPWNYLDDKIFSYPRKVYKIFAWNEWWKETLQKEYLVAPQKISIVGSARYDRLRSGSFKPTAKTEFFSKIGLNPEKKLITFAMVGEEWHHFQLSVIEFILEAIKSKRIAYPAQLLVRIGPKHKDVKKYLDLENKYEDFFVEESDKNPKQECVWNLINSSDVILSVFSSMALDAALLDKPMIYIGFTAQKNHPFNKILKKIFDFETIKQALNTGGVSVAFSEDDFIKKLNSAMQNPKNSFNGRKRLVAKFLGEKIKSSGERQAEEILASVKKNID